MSIEQWSDLMFPDKEGKDVHLWGSVKAVNSDGSYQVQLNTSSTTTRCAAGCTAGVGDRVLVCIMTNGRCVAVSRLEGTYAEFAKLVKFVSETNESIRIEHGKTNTNVYIRARRLDTGATVAFGVGSGGNNRGVYDVTGDHWIAYSDSTHPLYTKMPHLHITDTTDVSGTADNNAPFIIGNRAGSHMVMDSNEILAKSNGATPAQLNLNSDGGLVAIGSGGLQVSGRKYAQNKVLWSGGYYMNASQTATLSEAVSAQPNGIVLVWSYYGDGAAINSNFSFFFIPKHFVSAHNGKGMNCGAIFYDANMAKYVYVYDTSIVGHSSNSGSYSTGGCTFNNSAFVLRYVIGV